MLLRSPCVGLGSDDGLVTVAGESGRRNKLVGSRGTALRGLGAGKANEPALSTCCHSRGASSSLLSSCTPPSSHSGLTTSAMRVHHGLRGRHVPSALSRREASQDPHTPRRRWSPLAHSQSPRSRNPSASHLHSHVLPTDASLEGTRPHASDSSLSRVLEYLCKVMLPSERTLRWHVLE